MTHPHTLRALRRLVVTLAAVAVAGVLSGAAGCGTPAPSDSGVIGTVTLGPLQPVVQADGPPNERPCAAVIDIYPADTKDRAATARSGEDGRFTVCLAPGRYTLVPLAPGGGPFPHAAPLEVIVAAHQFTAVRIDYDTGIRAAQQP